MHGLRKFQNRDPSVRVLQVGAASNNKKILRELQCGMYRSTSVSGLPCIRLHVAFNIFLHNGLNAKKSADI